MVDMASKDFSNDLSLASHSSSVFPLKTMSSILRFVEVDDSYHEKRAPKLSTRLLLVRLDVCIAICQSLLGGLQAKHMRSLKVKRTLF